MVAILTTVIRVATSEVVVILVAGSLANDIIVESALSVLDADMSTDVPMNLVVNLDIPY